MQTKQRLINRLRWYYPMELAHAVFTFPALLLFTIYYFPIQEVIFLSYGLLVCISILYQGQRYWNIKLKSLRGQSIDVAKQLSFFKKSKKRNVVLIAAMPIVFILQMALNQWEMEWNRVLLFGVLANAFAILEHINYYHTQLMIDNQSDVAYVLRNKRLKTASLANDLRRGRF